MILIETKVDKGGDKLQKQPFADVLQNRGS